MIFSIRTHYLKFVRVIIFTGLNIRLILPVYAEESTGSQLSELLHVFAKLPSCGLSQIPCLPTPNDQIYEDDGTGYVARSRTNDQYGLPGWTRSQGGRFHKGVDILPIHFEKTKETVRIEYYDANTGRSFAKNESVLVPKDEIFSILDGVVVVVNKSEQSSGYGRYVILEHYFTDGTPFVSMYAHLNWLDVKQGDQVRLGDRIGWMGRTSSNSGGRAYLKAIPHCHFEIGRVIDNNFSNTRTAKLLYPKILGGKFDPRNTQPYDPLVFLNTFKAQPKSDLIKDQDISLSKKD